MRGSMDWKIWLPIVLVASGLIYWAPAKESDLVQVSARAEQANNANAKAPAKPSMTQQAALAASSSLLEIRSRDGTSEATQAFRQQAWTPPQAKPVVKPAAVVTPPEIPPAPQAPPLPFRYLGRYVEGKQITVFLAHNDQNHALKLGETFAINYKLEEIKENSLAFIYLPLNQKQNMELGATP
jgi:hypothetical protein